MSSKEDVLMILDIWCNEMNHFSRVSEEDLEILYKKFKTRKKNYLSKKFPNGGSPKGSIFEYHMFKELGGLIMENKGYRIASKRAIDNEIVFCGVCGKNCGKRKDHNFAHSHIRKNRHGNRLAICNECDSIERKIRLMIN